MSAANSKQLHEDNRIDNWSYLWMAMFTAGGYVLFSIVHYLFGELVLKGFCAAVIIGLVFAMVYAVWKKTNSERRTVYLLLFISITLRLLYVIVTAKSGYEGESYEIFTAVHTDLTLPESYQPLYYVAAAAVYNFTGMLSIFQPFGIEIVRVITEYLGIVSAIAMYYILCEMEANDTAIYLGTSIIAFHPGLIILGGEISPAMTTFTLLVMTVLFLSRWNNFTDGYNFLMMSIAFGLAVMSDLSALLFVPVIATLMIINLARAIKRRSALNIISTSLQTTAGLAIWAILSFTYPVRNYMAGKDTGLLRLFGEVSQHRDTVDLHQRFMSFSIEELFALQVNDSDKNAWAYWIKSSLFGANPVNIATEQLTPAFAGFVAIAAAVAMISALMVISNIFTHLDAKKKVNVWTFIALTVCSVIYYILVNIGRPETGSMAFRVVPIALALGMTMLGSGLKALSMKKKLNFVAQILYFFIVLICFAYCVVNVIYGALFI